MRIDKFYKLYTNNTEEVKKVFDIKHISTADIVSYNNFTKKTYSINVIKEVGQQIYPVLVLEKDNKFHLIDDYCQYGSLKKMSTSDTVLALVINNDNIYDLIINGNYSNLNVFTKEYVNLCICDLANKYFMWAPKNNVNLDTNTFYVKTNNILDIMEALSIFPDLINQMIYLCSINRISLKQKNIGDIYDICEQCYYR